MATIPQLDRRLKRIECCVFGDGTDGSGIGGMFVTLHTDQFNITGNKGFQGNVYIGPNTPTVPTSVLEVEGTSTFKGDILVSPNNTNRIGLITNTALEVWSRGFFSNNTLNIGTQNASGTYFQNTNSSGNTNRIGGFFATTRNFFLQAAGITPSDTGHRFQDYGNAYIQGYIDHPVQTATIGTTYSLTVTSPAVILTLTDNVALSMVNHNSGLSTLVRMVIVQDGTGGRLITWSNVLFPGGATPTLSSTPNARDIIWLLWDGTYWNFVESTFDQKLP